MIFLYEQLEGEEKMGIPNEVYFGEKPEGGGINYGEVRLIDDDQRKLHILKSRLDVLLIGQIRELSKTDVEGKRLIGSPFPLCILTLLSIETLGRVIADIEKIKKESEFDQSKKIVTPILGMMDPVLLHKPSKRFYEAFELIHGTKDKKAINRYSDVIHKYQRNTFNHGYQARGVFVDHSINQFWILVEHQGIMVINPYLFWIKFEQVYKEVFVKILSGKEVEWRNNALKYLEKLIL